jgi:hypothetical protein
MGQQSPALRSQRDRGVGSPKASRGMRSRAPRSPHDSFSCGAVTTPAVTASGVEQQCVTSGRADRPVLHRWQREHLRAGATSLATRAEKHGSWRCSLDRYIRQRRVHLRGRLSAAHTSLLESRCSVRLLDSRPLRMDAIVGFNRSDARGRQVGLVRDDRSRRFGHGSQPSV